MERDKDVRRAGVWIDHKQACVVILENGRVKFVRIQSSVEKHVRLSGELRSKRDPGGPQGVADEKKMERRRTQQLDRFYEEVTRAVENAGQICLFGPGEAKRELAKKLGSGKMRSTRVLAVMRADKLSDAQVTAKVKAFYGARTR